MTKHLYGISGQEEVEALKSLTNDETKKMNNLMDTGVCPSCFSEHTLSETNYFECTDCGFCATN